MSSDKRGFIFSIIGTCVLLIFAITVIFVIVENVKASEVLVDLSDIDPFGQAHNMSTNKANLGAVFVKYNSFNCTGDCYYKYCATNFISKGVTKETEPYPYYLNMESLKCIIIDVYNNTHNQLTMESFYDPKTNFTSIQIPYKKWHPVILITYLFVVLTIVSIFIAVAIFIGITL